jgi:2-dehydropantoate 2-reductase
MASMCYGRKVKTMQVAVMGAGAVGCYFGAVLARAGHAVTLIGRAARVDAVGRDGLLLETASGTTRVAVQAHTEPAAVRDAQLVLVCVKSGDTESAGALIAPHLAPAAAVWSLQNGVDNAARLQAVLQREVTPVLVYVAVEMAAAGHVKHHGRGDLVIGPSAANAPIAALFVQAGVPVETSANVVGAQWAKLILNCAWNALSALTGLPYGALLKQDGIEALLHDIVGECLAVAKADVVVLPGDAAAMWAHVKGIAQTMPNQLSSTAQDLARGRVSEIDHLNGHVIRRGAAHGIATPANRTLLTLVKAIESRDAARVA